MIIRQSDGGSVHISAASIEDTGSYSCYAKNDAGSTKRDIRLFVQGDGIYNHFEILHITIS